MALRGVRRGWRDVVRTLIPISHRAGRTQQTLLYHKKFAQTGAVLQLKQSFLNAPPEYQARPIKTF